MLSCGCCFAEKMYENFYQISCRRISIVANCVRVVEPFGSSFTPDACCWPFSTPAAQAHCMAETA